MIRESASVPQVRLVQAFAQKHLLQNSIYPSLSEAVSGWSKSVRFTVSLVKTRLAFLKIEVGYWDGSPLSARLDTGADTPRPREALNAGPI